MTSRDVIIDIKATVNGKTLDELSHGPTTGSDVQRQFGRMMARLVARYGLTAVSGRPEELIRPRTSRGVSLGYGCKTIRVRRMEGRRWVDWQDYQIKDDWQNNLDDQCDDWFDWYPPAPIPHPMDSFPVRRAIRDNPQA